MLTLMRWCVARLNQVVVSSQYLTKDSSIYINQDEKKTFCFWSQWVKGQPVLCHYTMNVFIRRISVDCLFAYIVLVLQQMFLKQLILECSVILSKCSKHLVLNILSGSDWNLLLWLFYLIKFTFIRCHYLGYLVGLVRENLCLYFKSPGFRLS